MKPIHKIQEERIAELERELADAKEILKNRSESQLSLLQQLTEALAACEVKNAAISEILEWCVCQDSKYHAVGTEALAIKPNASALLLHDAKLLEEAAGHMEFGCDGAKLLELAADKRKEAGGDL